MPCKLPFPFVAGAILGRDGNTAQNGSSDKLKRHTAVSTLWFAIVYGDIHVCRNYLINARGKITYVDVTAWNGSSSKWEGPPIAVLTTLGKGFPMV